MYITCHMYAQVLLCTECLCCLMMSGLSKDIRCHTRQLYWHQCLFLCLLLLNIIIIFTITLSQLFLLLIFYYVQYISYSGRGIRKNRAHCDRNLIFGTMIEYDKTKILRYRAIAGLSLKQNGCHFSNWLLLISIFPLS